MAHLKSVTCLDGFRVRVLFHDDSERVIDLEPYLVGPIFAPLRRDPRLFRAVRVDPESETLSWPNGADICPDVLYHGRRPVAWDRS